jgi:hypothetical protein
VVVVRCWKLGKDVQDWEVVLMPLAVHAAFLSIRQYEPEISSILLQMPCHQPLFSLMP